jgi:hypothetical protein
VHCSTTLRCGALPLTVPKLRRMLRRRAAAARAHGPTSTLRPVRPARVGRPGRDTRTRVSIV